jgi:predicted Rossmann fold nucleotide-binding protein DprA/Smf involved in DNA uptake
MRVPAEYKQPLDQSRLLLLSPFDEKIDRVTLETASFRNRFVAAIADAIFVAHAEPAGKTEQFCSEVLGWKKTLYTLKGDANMNLVKLGAKAIDAENTQGLC